MLYQQNFAASKTHARRSYNFAAGTAFELEVAGCLRSAGYFARHNLCISRERDFLSQIDILVIHKTGLYVIECKNWTGCIVGSAQWNRWLQADKFRPHGRYLSDVDISTREVLNPFRQNDYHVQRLAESLRAHGFIHIPIHSIVVFRNNFNLSFAIPDYRTDFVLSDKLLDKLNTMCRNCNASDNLSDEMVKRIIRRINENK